MASSYTSNFELEKQSVGDNVDTWGDPTLNTNVIQRVDDALGKTTEIAVASSNITLSQTQWRSKCIKLTGTLSANIVISLPLSVNSVGSATAVGGEIIFDNQTSGAFTVTVKTAATGSTGVEIPQGYRSVLYSNTVSVTFSDDQSRSTVLTYAGNPNGNVAGAAGSVNTPATMTWDRTNQVMYVCTTAGDASGAVHTAISGPVQAPQGYLTASSSADNVILTGDSVGATRLYYTPYLGNFIPIFNGTSFVPVSFPQMTVDLTASQAASSIYDVYLFFNSSGVLTIGFSPSWAAGNGGSVTPGSCVRGTGIGGAAIQRQGGIWVNAAAMTLNNGATTYNIDANRGAVVGSVLIDSTQGQVSCYRTVGQNRKFGVWNFYNRAPIMLQVTDPTSSWTYSSSTVRPSNNSASNVLSVFCGLAEEMAAINFDQNISTSSAALTIPQIGIGVNSPSAMSGFDGTGYVYNSIGQDKSFRASYVAPPALGVNNYTALEASTNNGTSAQFRGTVTNMLMAAQFRG